MKSRCIPKELVRFILNRLSVSKREFYITTPQGPHPAACSRLSVTAVIAASRHKASKMIVTNFHCFFKIRKCFGNLQNAGPQRIDPEMVFIFSVNSSRVDAISGLLCNLMAAWKPEIDFFFRNGHIRTGLTVRFCAFTVR
jgi:hypothetical protein